ncbi:hypothetical protein AWC27_05905 [Mycobacterium szulgai]|uniref:Uncharacterized protein n=1 Tax=Mycobacterium szulgai TaxID=1787 RepID=A0A1X2E6A5_MYCSZ|nr:hypothetical protein AWC27_05905 [Mycobacterium szulgai]
MIGNGGRGGAGARGVTGGAGGRGALVGYWSAMAGVAEQVAGAPSSNPRVAQAVPVEIPSGCSAAAARAEPEASAKSAQDSADTEAPADCSVTGALAATAPGIRAATAATPA